MADGNGPVPAMMPVSKAERVQSLDVLRGVAVLGILMMNITAFGLVRQAYDNPLVEGGAEGLNLLAYKIINVGFEGTMRGIFSLLFGASIVLLIERMEQAGAGVMAADVHFRRMLWMMVFGIVHWTLLLWYGEILFAYSLCGMVLFAFRKLSPRINIGIALAILAVAAGWQTKDYNDAVIARQAAVAVESAKAGGAKLDSTQEKAIEAWQDLTSHTMPDAEQAEEQRSWHRGSYWSAVTGQLESSFAFQWKGAPFWLVFDMIPFMLLGMGLLRLGVLGATLPLRTYILMAVGGYGIGIPLGLHELGLMIGSNFAPLGFAEANRTYELSRLAMVVGHLGVVLVFIHSGALRFLQRALAATGQMALSNYIAQTIICTIMFYGFGLGLFGAFERYQLYFVVAAIWAAELVWSPIWLATFRFGPLEWLWRSLTYWRWQPMKLA